ncbi:MAG TPA: TonB-dependent receptor [Bacteroidetes bacterium]|nr:TonB-dependent receptor [Bacteroidota bacterium]
MIRHLFFTFLFLFIFHLGTHAQVIVKGRVQDANTGEDLIGASVIIKGTSTGTVTEIDGTFELKVPSLPVALVVSYTGFAEKEIEVADVSGRLDIRLETQAILTEVIEVKGQRVDEKKKSYALTIESLDPIAIKQTASENFYDGLGALKGVDLTSASLGIKVVNTRGFNSTAPVRILQTIDGVDNSSPSVNFALGNFLGSSELDLRSVDLIVGASSAFYGPNAFNGVIKMDSKNPFFSKGLSAFAKAGERNILETGIRWADALRNKDGQEVFAYKFNFTYLTADDWEADNYAPIDSSRVPADHYAGYDAVNIHGDEYDPVFDLTKVAPWSTRGMTIFYRNGYRESELLDYETDNYKANMSLNLRLKPELGPESPELIWANNFSQGSTIFQGSARFRLIDVRYLTSRLELRRRDKFFLRAYVTTDDVGDTYNPFATAQKLNETAKTNEIWASLYTDAWLTNFGQLAAEMGYPLLQIVNGQPVYDFEARDAFFADPVVQDSLASWHRQTTDIVNASSEQGSRPFLRPGTPEFEQEFERITSTLTSAGGAKFFTNSEVYHVLGEYIFRPQWMDKITVGGSFRLYTPDTKGTIFADTTDLITITNREFGMYAGVEKKMLNNRLTAALTARVDKNENFDWISTPAASLVYKPSENDYLRLSFSSAVRNPTLPDQYFWLDVGPAIFAGSVNGYDSLLTVESFENFALDLDANRLQYFDVAPIQPEKVKTLEAGYRTIFKEKLYLDASYYYNVYDRFLGFRVGLDVEFNELNLPSDVEVLRVSTNSQSRVTTQGFAIGFNYYFKRYYQFSGNYTWSKLNTQTDDEIIPAFNTPEHKYNISLSGRDVPIRLGTFRSDNFGFNINYKWIDGFLFEGSPQFTGLVPQYDLLDCQVNYEFQKINTTLKIGASNILDNRHFETVGGPLVGRLAYIKLTYQFDKK